jgi:ribonucleoside-diphosphate reductase alpha chain
VDSIEATHVRATKFTHPASVDTWDQWFRWRDADGLHDRTIDATWERAARALVPPGQAAGAQRASRYVEAFGRWQLLPDERLLRIAGTGEPLGKLESPRAVLNAAAFVIAPGTRQARLDTERFVEVATLAVTLLDDASLCAEEPKDPRTTFRIGVIGFADALHLLGADYLSGTAIELSRTLGAALAMGTVHGELQAIEERGPLRAASKRTLTAWRKRGVPEPMLVRIALEGLRHDKLTAIVSQPLLALLANQASDALDPHPATDGFSGQKASDPNTCGCARHLKTELAAARRAIHAAIQPWIDAPIKTDAA